MEYTEAIRSIASLLCARNWAERNAGNFSVRMKVLPDDAANWPARDYLLPGPFPALEGQILMLSAAGVRMREMAVQTIPAVVFLEMPAKGITARLFYPPERQAALPTSELATHLEVQSVLHTQRPEEKALLHAHALPLIVLSHHPAIVDDESLNDILLRVHPETAFFLPQGAGFVPFLKPGSRELGKASAEAFHKHSVLIWEKHGTLACGPDLEEAFDRLDIAARAATIYLMCKQSGFTPRFLEP